MRGLYIALRAYMELYVDLHRGKGRTTALVDAAQPGDWIIVGNAQEVDRVDRELRRRGKENVRITAVQNLDALGRAFHQRGPIQGQVIFDHAVVENIFRDALVSTDAMMCALVDKFSRHQPEPRTCPDGYPVPPALADRVRGRFG